MKQLKQKKRERERERDKEKATRKSRMRDLIQEGKRDWKDIVIRF